MQAEDTREFKRTVRFTEQVNSNLKPSEIRLETAVVRHLRGMSSHALSEFLRSAVQARFVKEKLALAVDNTGIGQLDPVIQEYIRSNHSDGGAK